MKLKQNKLCTMQQYRHSGRAILHRSCFVEVRFLCFGHKIPNKFPNHRLIVILQFFFFKLNFKKSFLQIRLVDISDPFAIVSARHFKQLLTRFGAPIIILNLVKVIKRFLNLKISPKKISISYIRCKKKHKKAF